MGKSELDPRITAFRDSYYAGVEYARPYWEAYSRLYELWRGRPFEELSGTLSKINLMLFHSAVQDRLPKIHENIFATQNFVSLRADTPVAEFSKKGAEAWLKELLCDTINLPGTIMPTLQTTLIGGTAYRMPYVTYDADGEPIIGSRDVDFFHVIPAPLGGQLNPWDNQQENAVPWVMIVDWMPESKIKMLAEKGKFDKAAVGKLLGTAANEVWLEDQYRNSFSTVGKLKYLDEVGWRMRLRNIKDDPSSKSRRVVHWIRRDRHLIIGEDAYVLYDGENEDGIIPLAKYTTCPDRNGWFGIPYLQIQEDIIKAIMMNTNLRMDNLLTTLFPRDFIPKELAEAGRYTERDFLPKPYDVKFYSLQTLRGVPIQNAIYTDRRKDVTPQTFMDEDRLKAFWQKVAGMAETTSSLGDVVGNKTATGVTAILGELSGRPNMESTHLEYTGLREECQLLLALGAKHIQGPQRVRMPGSEDGFDWGVVDADDIKQSFTVETHGTRYLADKNQSIQRALAFYPLFNNNPVWDQYELNRQIAQVADVLPDPDKALISPETAMTMGGPQGGMPGQPGGMASALDMAQQSRSVENRTGVEPRTGRQTPAKQVNR